MSRQYILTRSGQVENVYGAFLKELLVSEGFMGFELVDIDTAPMPRFTAQDMVVVTRCHLRDAEFAQIKDAISQGASAAIIQPQSRFAAQFGWKCENWVIHPAYVGIDKGYPGSGQPLQTHLPVPVYIAEGKEPKDWRVVAKAFDKSWEGGGSPAVVSGGCGSGKLTFLFYDLPEAVARIRFGNPDLAGYCTSGIFRWPHAFDLFAGHLDERLKHVPQADLHCQLMAKLLTETSPYPLPRLWYYEEVADRTACVFQSDDDYSKPEDFEALARAAEKRGGAISFYLMENTKLSMEQIRDLEAHGHTVAPHIDASGSFNGAPVDDVYFNFPERLEEETRRFDGKYGRHGATLQPHCSPWRGHLETIPAHIRNGYRLLFAYMCFLPANEQGDPVGCQAGNWGNYLCGSGRPIKFFDRQSKVQDCWQQPLLFFDDGIYKDFFALTDRAVQAFASKLEDSAIRTHSTLSILSHPVSFTSYSGPAWEAALDLLQAGGHKIYSGDKWLEFQDRRAGVSVSHKTLPDGTLQVGVENLNGRLPLMIPAHGVKEIQVNGGKTAGIRRELLSDDYVFIQLDSSKHVGCWTIEVK